MDRGHGSDWRSPRMLGHITYLSPEVMAEKFAAARSEPREIRSQFENGLALVPIWRIKAISSASDSTRTAI